MNETIDFATYGLIGSDVTRSFSPRVYNAVFEELGLAAVYMPFSVAKERFLEALPVLRSDFVGFNVTAPFRHDILKQLDSVDESARRLGTANTIRVENGKLYGYNTEMVGFERSLIGFAGNLYDKDVLLVGAGDVASAVAYVLLEKGAFLTIISRNMSHAHDLRDRLQRTYNKNRIRVVRSLTPADQFDSVFCTSSVDLESPESQISIHPHIYQSFRYVYTTSYKDTQFLKKAANFGAKTKNGFDMLFFQSIRSLEIWLGKQMDLSIVMRVHDNVLKSIAEKKEIAEIE
jgi:shikimate dehydrogenase